MSTSDDPTLGDPTLGESTQGEPTQRKPAPQYGEYASDQELASAIKRSGGTPERSDPPAPQVIAASQAPLAQPARQRKSVDRIVTVFLLAFGFVYVVGGASTYLNLGTTLQETMKRFGMGDYEPTSQTAAIGVAMLVSQGLLWLIAAVWSYRRLSQRKVLWWVPVMFGVISFLVLTVLLGILLAADPTFLPAMSKF